MNEVSDVTVFITDDYESIQYELDNRSLDLPKHVNLRESMKHYGYLKSFPISVIERDGRLFVKDGQHRFHFAKLLELPVYYIIEEVDYDVAEVNCTQKPWAPRDYAERYARAGNQHYLTLIHFAESYGITIPLAASLLYGVTSFSTQVRTLFQKGEFQVREFGWASRVAKTYHAIRPLSKNIRSVRFIEALMAVCRIDDFDTDRLIQNAQRWTDLLRPVSTRDACLDMIEHIYNYRRSSRMMVKYEASTAMDLRNPTKTVAAKKRT